jgi:hypothetical protein
MERIESLGSEMRGEMNEEEFKNVDTVMSEIKPCTISSGSGQSILELKNQIKEAAPIQVAVVEEKKVTDPISEEK